MRTLTLGIALLILTGCATQSGVQQDLAALRQFTLADAQRAVEVSTAAKDAAGLQCAQGLVAILQETDVQLPPSVGVISEAARVRALRLAYQQGDLLKRINLSCAAAINDAVYTYGKLLGSLGLKALAP